MASSQQVEELEEQRRVSQSMVEEQANEIAKLQDELEAQQVVTHRASLDDFERKELEVLVHQQTEKIASLEEEIEDHRQRIIPHHLGTKDAPLEGIDGPVDAQYQSYQIASLEKELQVLNEQLETEQVENADKSDRIDTLESRVKGQKLRISELEDGLECATQELEEMEHEMEVLFEQNDGLKEETGTLQEEIRTLRNELEEERNAVQNSDKSTEAEYLARIDELTKTLDDKDMTLQHMYIMIRQLREQVQKQERERDDNRGGEKAAAATAAKIKMLEKQVASQLGQIRTLTEKLKQSKYEVDAMGREMEAMFEENDNFKGALGAQLDEAQRDLDDKEETIRELREALAHSESSGIIAGGRTSPGATVSSKLGSIDSMSQELLQCKSELVLVRSALVDAGDMLRDLHQQNASSHRPSGRNFERDADNMRNCADNVKDLQRKIGRLAEEIMLWKERLHQTATAPPQQQQHLPPKPPATKKSMDTIGDSHTSSGVDTGSGSIPRSIEATMSIVSEMTNPHSSPQLAVATISPQQLTVPQTPPQQIQPSLFSPRASTRFDRAFETGRTIDDSPLVEDRREKMTELKQRMRSRRISRRGSKNLSNE